MDPGEIVMLRTILAPFIAASLLRRGTSEVLKNLTNLLPPWLTGGLPPDPPPSAQAAGSAGAEPGTPAASLPGPLTISRGWPQRGPNGEQYSFSEASAPEKPVSAVKIPDGLTIPVKSGDPREGANRYQVLVVEGLGFDPGPKDYSLGGKMPDGVMTTQEGAQIALEVKYLSKSKNQIRDPARNLQFAFPKDVIQATKYLEEYQGGLLWVTNDYNLAEKYNEMFEKANLSGVRVVVIPSIEE